MSINKIFIVVSFLLPNFTFPMQNSEVYGEIKNIRHLVRPLSRFEDSKHYSDSFPKPGDYSNDLCNYHVEHDHFFLLLSEASKQVQESNKEPFNELMGKIITKQVKIERTNYFSTVKVTAKDLYYRLFPYIWWLSDLRRTSQGIEHTVLISNKLATLRMTWANPKTCEFSLHDFSSHQEISRISWQDRQKAVADLLRPKAAL